MQILVVVLVALVFLPWCLDATLRARDAMRGELRRDAIDDLLAPSERLLARAREAYVAGDIEVESFEAALDRWLPQCDDQRPRLGY